MELTIEQALRQGVAAHKEGKLQDAEQAEKPVIVGQEKIAKELEELNNG